MESSIIDYFLPLVKINSESKNEEAIAIQLEKDLKMLGGEVQIDRANEKTGGNIGNVYAYFPGNINKDPILFCAHMDTVHPGNDVKPKILADRITSDGTTILGSDDKSGIAQIIWAIRAIKENKIDHAPIEVLFTISEEIGLLGAKNLDYSLLKSKLGYALDSHTTCEIIVAAPSQINMKYIIHGKEAHAGVNPEKGLNVIKIAADAISKMPSGSIDKETTCNIGIIKGGKATNIVPNLIIIEAEARSHNQNTLHELVDSMSNILKDTVKKYKVGDFQAKVDIEIEESYEAFHFKHDSPVVQLAIQTNNNLGIPAKTSIGGGGSDANILNKKGLSVAVIGTGMRQVHTLDEYILISDLELGAKWVEEIIKVYSKT